LGSGLLEAQELRNSGAGEDDDFDLVGFFADAAAEFDVIDEAEAGIETHGVVQFGGPGSVRLQVLAGAFVPHNEAHEGEGTCADGSV
jgi:hypothetical protein